MIFMAFSACLAFFAKGLCGFANALVFTTMLSFRMNLVNITPLTLLLGTPTNIIMAWRERRYIDWKLVMPLLGLVMLGEIPGVFLLTSADGALIKAVLGGVIVLLGISMLRPQPNGSKKPSWPVITVVSVISGFLCGLYGIGALLAVLCAQLTDNSHAAKGTLNVILLGDNAFRLVMYAVTGILTWPLCRQALMIFPFALLGLVLSMRCIDRVNERTARLVIILALIISGAALIVTNL